MTECETPLQQSVVSWTSPFLVVGLACSLYSFVFCCGQILRAISAEGFFPRCLQGRRPSQKSLRKIVSGPQSESLDEVGMQSHRGEDQSSLSDVPSNGGSPIVALHVGGALIVGVLLMLYAAMGPAAADAMSAPLVSLALLGGCTSYILQLIAFISSRRSRDLEKSHSGDYGAVDSARHAEKEHAFRSPCGVGGAIVAIIIAGCVIAAIVATGFINNDGGAAAQGTLVVNILYFILLAITMGHYAALNRVATSGGNLRDRSCARRCWVVVLTCGGQCHCGAARAE